jgi:hypothetical protein
LIALLIASSLALIARSLAVISYLLLVIIGYWFSTFDFKNTPTTSHRRKATLSSDLQFSKHNELLKAMKNYFQK